MAGIELAQVTEMSAQNRRISPSALSLLTGDLQGYAPNLHSYAPMTITVLTSQIDLPPKSEKNQTNQERKIWLLTGLPFFVT